MVAKTSHLFFYLVLSSASHGPGGNAWALTPLASSCRSGHQQADTGTDVKLI
jgi:hypothetical protein